MSELADRVYAAFSAHARRTPYAPQWVIFGNGVYYELVADKEEARHLSQTGPDTITFRGVPVLIVTNAPNLVYIA